MADLGGKSAAPHVVMRLRQPDHFRHFGEQSVHGSTANCRDTQLTDSDRRQICEWHKAYIALFPDQLPAYAADKPGLELVFTFSQLIRPDIDCITSILPCNNNRVAEVISK